MPGGGETRGLWNQSNDGGLSYKVTPVWTILKIQACFIMVYFISIFKPMNPQIGLNENEETDQHPEGSSNIAVNMLMCPPPTMGQQAQ